MTLRDTCGALKALVQVADDDWGWVYYDAKDGSGTRRVHAGWASSRLRTTCGRCGSRRRDHSALHLVHAQRRVAFKRARRRGTMTDLTPVSMFETVDRVFGSCLFVPIWAILLDVRRVSDANA